MKSLLFSLSGVLAFTLGVLANLELVLPDSVVRAQESSLPFEIEYLRHEEARTVEGFTANGLFYVVTLRIRNVSLEERVFPEGAVIVTDGQAETVPQHLGVHVATSASRGPLFWKPDEVRELEFCFDVPSTIHLPRLELEAAAFSSPDAGLVMRRRVLAQTLAR